MEQIPEDLHPFLTRGPDKRGGALKRVAPRAGFHKRPADALTDSSQPDLFESSVILARETIVLCC